MEKEKIKVLFDTDADGYIMGWSQEFWDGRQWQTPFDTTNAVELTADEIGGIVMGATKYADGKLTVDADKQKALADIAEPDTQTDPQVAALQAKVDTQNEAITQLTNLVVAVADPDKLNKALGL
ncbi:phage infection protein [Lacticaseibacillus suilingensis]|uniref:phage infection protein n=1 Tax=Lacticaseibacillus suilingensis TaxID=2799577 RepID=UPI0022E20A82|nr:phage infection protein [Lacticaseibacillus suilingensis]